MNSFKQFLAEQRSKETLVFAFGRYNPPTRGHILHFQAIRDFAGKNGYRYELFISKTVDNKKNPVAVEPRIEYIKKAIPAALPASPAMNMFTVVEELSKHPYKELIYMAGGDYFEEGSVERSMFARLVKYAADKGTKLSVQMSGMRQAGVSGTVLRHAVLNNDFETFLKASPIGMGRITEQDVRQMFELTKQGLSAAPIKRVKLSPVV